MENKNFEKLPENPIEAQGLLITDFYIKFGKEALQLSKKFVKTKVVLLD